MAACTAPAAGRFCASPFCLSRSTGTSMTRLPVIVGFGGINAAGRSSFHHGYRRTIFEMLDAERQQLTLRSLAALAGRDRKDLTRPEEQAWLLENSLIRRIQEDWFDPERTPVNRRLPLGEDRKSTRLNSSHVAISYAVFCLKKKTP